MLSVVTLRQQLAGADAETLTVAGQSLVASHDWTFLLGPGFCAGIGNGLLLALSGMVAGSLAVVAATGRCSASTSASPVRRCCSPSRR